MLEVEVLETRPTLGEPRYAITPPCPSVDPGLATRRRPPTPADARRRLLARAIPWNHPC